MHGTKILAVGSLVATVGCAQSQTTVLPSYQLDNGRRLQDVVSVAADPSGGAPSVTALTTYDISGHTTHVVARNAGSSPGVGVAVASGLGAAAGGALAGVATAAILHELDDNGTTVNASYATAGNTATNGDAGDIDAVTAGNLGGGSSISN